MKDNKKYTAISLFSGAGGMDIGISQGGFDVRACVEIDPYACETLRANISQSRGKTKVFEEDIKKINPANLLDELV